MEGIERYVADVVEKVKGAAPEPRRGQRQAAQAAWTGDAIAPPDASSDSPSPAQRERAGG